MIPFVESDPSLKVIQFEWLKVIPPTVLNPHLERIKQITVKHLIVHVFCLLRVLPCWYSQHWANHTDDNFNMVGLEVCHVCTRIREPEQTHVPILDEEIYVERRFPLPPKLLTGIEYDS